MTYSFPCTDLSLAGKRAGMSKDSGTRSGLLWEVERILNECGDELPQILLMENVPQVIGKKNIDDFKLWYDFLISKGYNNHYKLLNAKNFGIPQNRNRCFMVSILGEEYVHYKWPKTIPLKLKLKDMLEDNVDEKYYLSQKDIDRISNWNAYQKPIEEIKNHIDISPTLTARGAGEEHSGMILIDEDLLPIKNATKQGYLLGEVGDGIDISGRMESHRGTVQKDMSQTIKTQCDVGVVIPIKKDNGNYIEWSQEGRLDIDCRAYKADKIAPTTTTTPKQKVLLNNLRIRKLTPKECWRLMGFDDEDFDKAAKVNSSAQLYKQAGNSIVVNVLEAIFRQLL